MRQYESPRLGSEVPGQSAPVSPLSLLPLRTLALPPPLSQLHAGMAGERATMTNLTTHRRLTVFKTLSLKVTHAVRQVQSAAEADKS